MTARNQVSMKDLEARVREYLVRSIGAGLDTQRQVSPPHAAFESTVKRATMHAAQQIRSLGRTLAE